MHNIKLLFLKAVIKMPRSMKATNYYSAEAFKQNIPNKVTN